METGERWQLTELRATADLPAQDASLSGRGQVAQLPGMPQVPGTPPDDTLEDPLLLDLRLRLDDFEAGASHRAFGKRLDRAMTVPGMRADQEGSEVWLARRLGLVRLKVARSELSDNVDRNPALSRTKRSQTSLTGELHPPGWPTLALTLARGEAERSWLAGARAGAVPERQSFDSLTGALSYGGESWDFSSSTTLTRSRDAAGSADATTSIYHDLVVTLRLMDGLTLAPALSTGLDRYEPGPSQTTSGSANVTLSYQWPAEWRTWTYAGYTASRSSDRSADGRSITVTGGLSRDIGRMLGGRGSVSLEAGHRAYADALYPEGSSRETFAYLLFRLARF
jgi:hypothetical protein